MEYLSFVPELWFLLRSQIRVNWLKMIFLLDGTFIDMSHTDEEEHISRNPGKSSSREEINMARLCSGLNMNLYGAFRELCKNLSRE